MYGYDLPENVILDRKSGSLETNIYDASLYKGHASLHRDAAFSIVILERQVNVKMKTDRRFM